MASTALSVMKDASILPNEQELVEIMNDLADIIAENPRKLFATLRIAPAGANVFQVLEPGAEDYKTVAPPLRCVIVASHPLNTRWLGGFGEHQPGERPACSSVDGITGVDMDGVVHDCRTCSFNQFGVDSARKSCGNRTQLYILREGDVLPTLFSLPPSGKTAFNNYRVYSRVQAKCPLYAVVTELTLQTKKSRNGTPYSSLVFNAVGRLPQDVAAKVKHSIDAMVQTAQHSTALFDADASTAPVPPMPVDEQSGMAVADVDLPEGF